MGEGWWSVDTGLTSLTSEADSISVFVSPALRGDTSLLTPPTIGMEHRELGSTEFSIALGLPENG